MDDKEKENQTQDTNDYYEALKNESYKSMLNSEVQASVARDQAMKYTNNQINAAGYGTQGLAQSTNLGIQNTYQEALRNAAETHQANLLSINQSQREEALANQNKEFENLTALMSGATDGSTLDNIMSRYGITANSDGTFSYGEGSEFLNDSDKRQLESMYGLYQKSFEQEVPSAPVYTSLADLQNVGIAGSNGKVEKKLGEQFEEETAIAFAHAQTGELKAGDVVCLDNTNLKDNKGMRYYLMWTGNGFQIVTESEFNSATNKYTAKWISGKESQWIKG